jgi:hypothetical protein
MVYKYNTQDYCFSDVHRLIYKKLKQHNISEIEPVSIIRSGGRHSVGSVRKATLTIGQPMSVYYKHVNT